MFSPLFSVLVTVRHWGMLLFRQSLPLNLSAENILCSVGKPTSTIQLKMPPPGAKLELGRKVPKSEKHGLRRELVEQELKDFCA